MKPVVHAEPAGNPSKFKWVAGQNAAPAESVNAALPTDDHSLRVESVASG